jgi:hypothetical protein
MLMTKSDLGAHLSSLRASKKQIEEQIRQNRHSTLDELHQKFPQISRSLLNKILRKHLEYKKKCARWVPRMLADDHRKTLGRSTEVLGALSPRRRQVSLPYFHRGSNLGFPLHPSPSFARVASSSIAFKSQEV